MSKKLEVCSCVAMFGLITSGQSLNLSWVEGHPTGSPPLARFDHSAVYDPATKQMIVFGGRMTASPGANLNDLWTLENAASPTGSSWTSLNPVGAAPGPRRGQSAVYDDANSR